MMRNNTGPFDRYPESEENALFVGGTLELADDNDIAATKVLGYASSSEALLLLLLLVVLLVVLSLLPLVLPPPLLSTLESSM